MSKRISNWCRPSFRACGPFEVHEAADGVMEGTVKSFNWTKGYGFIGRDDGPDVFVNYSDIVGDGYRTLYAGDRITFEIMQGPKGPQAQCRESEGERESRFGAVDMSLRNRRACILTALIFMVGVVIGAVAMLKIAR